MGSPIQNHIREKPGLVHLTGLGTGDSDPDGDFVLHQIRQIIIGTIVDLFFIFPRSSKAWISRIR